MGTRVGRALGVIAGLIGMLSLAAGQWAVRDEFPTGKERGVLYEPERGVLYEPFTKAQWEASNFAAPQDIQNWQALRYGMFIHFGVTSRANRDLSWGSIPQRYAPDTPSIMANGAPRTGQRGSPHRGMDHLAAGHEAGEVRRQGVGRHRQARGI